jgi:hypothetical protein
MNPPTGPLRLVREDTGESIPFMDADVAGLQAEIQMLRDHLKGAERDTNTWRHRYQELRRDKDADARKDPVWPDAVRCFKLYCRLTGKDGVPRRLTWTVERFELIAPFLRKHKVGGCERAIVGRVFDHYSAKRKNGSTIRYWEWERIFKDAREFEESANRAPVPFVSELEAEDQLAARESDNVVAAKEAAATGQATLG